MNHLPTKSTEFLRPIKAVHAPETGRIQATDLTSIGSSLRSAREAKGLTLEELGSTLRLRTSILETLEQGDFKAMPEPVYTGAYLRNYALAVDLDPQPLVDAYTRSLNSSKSKLPPTREQPSNAPARELPKAVPSWVGIAAALVVAAALGAYFLISSMPAPAVGLARTIRASTDSGVVVVAPSITQMTPVATSQEPTNVALSVTSTPSGATVFLDGIRVGVTPLQTAPVSSGLGRELKLELPGYTTISSSVDLNTAKSVSFALLPTPIGATPQLDVNASTSSKVIVISFKGSSWIRVTNANGVRLYEGVPASDARLSFAPPIRVRAGRPDLVNATIGAKTRVLGSAAVPATISLP